MKTLILLTLVAMVAGCKVKDVETNSYTTSDGLVVTHVAHIAEFTLTCESGKAPASLWAELPTSGRIEPVVRSLDGKKYQVSWIEELNKASSGDKLVKILDEEKFLALRKSQRKAEETGSRVEAVEPMAVVVVNHRGTYKGPLIPAEVFSVALIVAIFYLTQAAKSQLVA